MKEYGALDEPRVRVYVTHVLRGVEYLHRQGIAHRDLKCANLMLSDDGIVKIGDFGTAKRATPAGLGSTDPENEDGDEGDDDDDDAAFQDTARYAMDGRGWSAGGN